MPKGVEYLEEMIADEVADQDAFSGEVDCGD
jgi:hypothetical protein